MSPSFGKLKELLPKRKPRAVDEDGEPVLRREGRAAGAWRGFRRSTDRYRLLTDVLGALVLVGLVVGGIAAATGGVWPPMIVVESGSMMHAIQDTHYGRIGTIDVGDMVFVRAVRGPQDVRTWADGGKTHYGRPGDIIEYAPNGDRNVTPVIHRAIAYVEVIHEGPTREARSYALHWIDGQVLLWDERGIYFPPLGFNEDWGFSPTNGFKPAYSGYVTKGDNSFSNPAADQAMPNGRTPISRLVEPTWIEGKVYGEIPWLGLAKLALQNGKTNPEVPGWSRVGNAFAPLELWTMFFLTVAIIVVIPVTLDTWRAWRRMKLEQETERRLEEENRRRVAQQKAALAAQAKEKRVTTFAAIVDPRRAAPPASTGAQKPPGR